jgi:hypothetical protein
MLAVSVGRNKRTILYHIITVFSNTLLQLSYVGCRLSSVGFQRLGVYLSVSVICQVLTIDCQVLLLLIAVVDS